ncbi:MAG TPA: LuxR C-terminal-related transcriptional regulator [bacterium]|nr:LuxR C-terminal-related transcriptional regulator [bacterium]
MGSPLIVHDAAELVAGTGDPAFAVDGEHTIIAWNRAAEEFFGYRAEDVLGRGCAPIVGGRDEQGHILCNTLCPLLVAVHRGTRPREMMLQVHRRTGEPLWVSMSTIVLGAGDPCVVHILRDVTIQRQREAFVHQLRQAAAALDGETPRPVEGPPVLLTPRETEILRLLASGAGTRGIAQTLSISPATVRNHIQQIMAALGAHSRLEAVVKAHQRQLL